MKRDTLKIIKWCVSLYCLRQIKFYKISGYIEIRDEQYIQGVSLNKIMTALVQLNVCRVQDIN